MKRITQILAVLIYTTLGLCAQATAPKDTDKPEATKQSQELSWTSFASSKELFQYMTIYALPEGVITERQLLEALKKVPGVEDAYTRDKKEVVVYKQQGTLWSEVAPKVIVRLTALAPYGAEIKRLPDPPPPPPLSPGIVGAIITEQQNAKKHK